MDLYLTKKRKEHRTPWIVPTERKWKYFFEVFSRLSGDHHPSCYYLSGTSFVTNFISTGRWNEMEESTWTLLTVNQSIFRHESFLVNVDNNLFLCVRHLSMERLSFAFRVRVCARLRISIKQISGSESFLRWFPPPTSVLTTQTVLTDWQNIIRRASPASKILG